MAGGRQENGRRKKRGGGRNGVAVAKRTRWLQKRGRTVQRAVAVKDLAVKKKVQWPPEGVCLARRSPGNLRGARSRRRRKAAAKPKPRRGFLGKFRLGQIRGALQWTYIGDGWGLWLCSSEIPKGGDFGRASAHFFAVTSKRRKIPQSCAAADRPPYKNCASFFHHFCFNKIFALK